MSPEAPEHVVSSKNISHVACSWLSQLWLQYAIFRMACLLLFFLLLQRGSNYILDSFARWGLGHLLRFFGSTLFFLLGDVNEKSLTLRDGLAFEWDLSAFDAMAFIDNFWRLQVLLIWIGLSWTSCCCELVILAKGIKRLPNKADNCVQDTLLYLKLL